MKAQILLLILFSGIASASGPIDPEKGYVESHASIVEKQLNAKFIPRMLEEGVPIEFGKRMLRETAESMAWCQVRAMNAAYDDRYIGAIYAVILMGGSAMQATTTVNQLMEYDVQQGRITIEDLGKSIGLNEKILDECVAKLKSR